MIPLLQDFKTVVLASGNFPEHSVPLSFLQKAERIICCDGAIKNLLRFGKQPDYIVGDLDSIVDELKHCFSSIIFHNPDQETNDLTKSVRFCVEHGWHEISILGATGKREDHTLGNLSLLGDYAETVRVQMLTDYGVFTPALQSAEYASFSGQQVSIFSFFPITQLTTHNLVYPIHNKSLLSLWQGTLNEATTNIFGVEMNGKGKILIFRQYPLTIQ